MVIRETDGCRGLTYFTILRYVVSCLLRHVIDDWTMKTDGICRLGGLLVCIKFRLRAGISKHLGTLQDHPPLEPAGLIRQQMSSFSVQQFDCSGQLMISKPLMEAGMNE